MLVLLRIFCEFVRVSGGSILFFEVPYNKNFETIPGEKGTKVFKGKGNSWIHHMVPDNVMRSDPLYQRAFELGIFNPDRTSNLIELAADKDVLDLLLYKR
jgi:hypothetical protein